MARRTLMVGPLAAGCALLFSGCAVSSQISIDATGGVLLSQSVTLSKAIASQAPLNITSVAQWENFVRTGGGQQSSVIPPGATCTFGEDSADYSADCQLSGDVSDLSGGIVSFSRQGDSVVATLVTDASVPGAPENSVTRRAELTLPGAVSAVAGGAVQVDGDTVSFDNADLVGGSMTATFTLPSAPGQPVPVSVSVGAPAPQADGSTNWIADVVTDVPDTQSGSVTVYVCSQPQQDPTGCTEAGSTAVTAGTTAITPVSLDPGQHYLISQFSPEDWWDFDVSTGSVTVTAVSFVARVAPRVVGEPQPRRVLRVALGRWTPAPTSVKYRWARESTAVSGESVLVRVPRGTRDRYRVTAADEGHRLKVRVTVRAPGLPSRSAWFDGPFIPVSGPAGS